MQRPPRPILLSRPVYEWINRVSQQHRRLAELQISPGQRKQLQSWNETEFVCSTLKLEGLDPSRKRVLDLINSAGKRSDDVSREDRVIEHLIEGLLKVEDLAQTQGRSATLTPAVLLSLEGGTEFRKGAGDPAHGPNRVHPDHLPASIEAACAWFAAESFNELNPVEQASIACLRLMEIQPFEKSTSSTALIAASLFTLRAGLPPVIIYEDQFGPYERALEEGTRMNTQPMVELIATSLARTLDQMIDLITQAAP